MASLLVILYFPLGYALPTLDVHHARALGTDDGSGSKPSIKLIVPVVIAVVFFVALLAFGLWRRHRRNREFINQLRNNSSTTNTTTTPATTTNANPTTISAPGTGPDAPARPARRRRRRRPSQISTKSLPAYNEQAGDEEIVLVRRAQRDSMSDDDDDGTQEDGRRPTNETSTSIDGTPLLDDTSPEMRRMSLASSTRGRSMGDRDRESDSQHQPIRTESSSGGSASPTTAAAPANDTDAPQPSTETTAEAEPSPLGDAPAYSEAVRANQEEPAATHENTSPEHAQVSESITSVTTRPSIEISGPPPETDGLGTIRAKRKSAFRQFFGLNKAGSSSAAPSDSVEMAPSHRQSLSASSAQASGSHRPSNSISTLASMSASGHGHTLSPSLSSLLLTRSRSPTRSTDSLAQRMNISAPIPTTLIRTELSYPRSGPTPEQIRFLSSRESLGRFGMPYGEEALAAARSRENISAIRSPPQYEAHSPGNVMSEIPTDNVTDSQNPQAAPAAGPTVRAPLLTPGEIYGASSPPPGMIRNTQTSSPPPNDRSTPPPSSSAEVTTDDDRRASVFTTNSFVTAAEGSGDSAAEDDTVEAPDHSPPTPTAETYRQAETQASEVPPARPRGQTILVPESQGDHGNHPELSFIPATPTVEVPQRNND